MPVNKINRGIHIFCLSGIGMFLPLSEFIVSLFMILLSANWLVTLFMASGQIIKRIKNPMSLFLLAYLVYILSLFISSDMALALSALRLKLPLLVLPVIIITTPIASAAGRRVIYYSFIAGVLIASVVGYLSWKINPSDFQERREISLYISHIRLSLMVIVAAVLAFYLAKSESTAAGRFSLLISGVWHLLFLTLLFSFTGLVISALVALFLIIRLVLKSRVRMVRIGLPVITSLLIILIVVSTDKELNLLFEPRDSDAIDLNLQTQSGNSYTHYSERKDRENGYFVWRYICTDELRKEWNSVSSLDYDGKDFRGNKLEYTLIRYLASKGLKKDSAGISELDLRDIEIIERGYANNLYRDSKLTRTKLYEIFWQIDYYRNGGNPQGHSLTQRLEFMKTGFRVFKRYPILGTGTGDFNFEMQEQYNLDGSLLDLEHRRSTHNQFLLSLATFGIPGASLFWIGIFIPLFIRKRQVNILLTIFMIVIITSMMWEDTLETHTGVSFFVFFYFILCFYQPQLKQNE